MAEFTDVMHDFDLFCTEYLNDIDGCDVCPLSVNNNGHDESCEAMLIRFPEEAEKIITTWKRERHCAKPICSMCGRPLNEWDIQENFEIDFHSVGYGSRYDGEHIRAVFCCDCFDKFIQYIEDNGAVSPIVGSDAASRTHVTKSDVVKIIGGS